MKYQAELQRSKTFVVNGQELFKFCRGSNVEQNIKRQMSWTNGYQATYECSMARLEIYLFMGRSISIIP